MTDYDLNDLPRNFGVVYADPPWGYDRSREDERLRGYSTDKEYAALSTADLKALPVGDYCGKDAVLLLWTTWPFIQDGLDVVKAWGFKYVTGLPWVKATSMKPVGHDGNGTPILTPTYGVGYWMRGATEPLLIAKRGRAVRTPYIGLISENFRHSRKPDSAYELAETFADVASPGAPRLELFARQRRDGWYALGLEAPGDGMDIRERLAHT